MDPENSWVARWQRTCKFCGQIESSVSDSPFSAKYVRGMYAARVAGRIPEDVEDDITAQGFSYRPRDETGE